MIGFWNFFLQKRQFTYLFVVFLAVLGVFSLVAIPKESTPEVVVPIGVITTILPGASPDDVERLVTDVIESAIEGVEDVSESTSTSRESLSSVVVTFNAQADIEKGIDALQDAVDDVKIDLPSDAEEPIVSDVDFSEEPILIISLAADLPSTSLKNLAEETKREIQRVPGVARVSITGVEEREVSVIVDAGALETFEVRLTDIVSAIRAADVSLPIGSIETGPAEYTVRFDGAITSTRDVENIPVFSRGGEPVFIRDIARVIDNVEPAATLSRTSTDGGLSIRSATLNIQKRSGGNIIEIANAVKGRLTALEETVLADASVLISFDTADQIQKDLGDLVGNGAQTIMLVMLVLFVAVGIREGLIAGLAIPLSFLLSFIGLFYSGNTINFVSLFSLILAIGILVDSAIVIVEAMHTKMRAGVDGLASAGETIRNYNWPLISGTMTTVAVFVPLFFISGVTGEFIASIPFTVIAVLVAALLVALAIIPLVSARALKQGDSQTERSNRFRTTLSRFARRREQVTKRLTNSYHAFLSRLAHNPRAPRRVLFGAIALLLLGFALPFSGVLRVTFFPQSDVPFIFVDVERPIGTPLGETNLSVREVEAVLHGDSRIASFVSTVGSASAFTTGQGGAHRGNLTINLADERDESSSEIVSDLERAFADIQSAEVRIFEPSGGPPTGAPISIKLFGDDLDVLDTAAQDIERILASVSGTREVSRSTGDGALEFVLRIDRAKAAALGVTPSLVAQTLRTAIFGATATTIENGQDDIDVVVSLGLSDNAFTREEARRATIDDVRRIVIETSRGGVLLGSIITTDIVRSNAAIQHENGERFVSVESFLDEGAIAADVVSAFEERIATHTVPAGVLLVVGGENEEVDQSFRDMFRALFIGLFLIAAILVLQFNSFRYALYIVLLPPLSLAGLLFGLTLAGQTLSFPSMMGFITLAGIVVNNAIILIDAANTNYKAGMSVRGAMLSAAASRLRPILLTTITTVVGILPLAFSSDLWGPLAVAVIFGLSYSLLLTLFLTPLIYIRWPGKIKE